jgi:hypothetical protein
MAVAAPQLRAGTPGLVAVNIFGDGNPLNGVEDDREAVMAGVLADDGSMSAGTISCDGKFRGTAMVVDSREFAPAFKGVVLVSAAHVLYDLENKRRFKRCRFHFMGFETAGFRAKIDLKNVRTGDFDPQQVTTRAEFGEGDWAFLYLPRPWKKFNPDLSLRVREFAFARGESYQQSGGEFRLLAFDSRQGVVTQSKNCTVVESGSDDLGGGTWKGQLLDDCDSADGASGGGIIAVWENQHFLIGIRGGSHWSQSVYPDDLYPSGPPDGSVWNRHSNTNFGRAIDNHLLREMSLFIQSQSQ